jgi:fucose permease
VIITVRFIGEFYGTYLISKYDVKQIMAISTFILIASVFIASFTTNFIVFFFVWGFVFAFSIALFLWIPLTIGSEWFPHNKGLVNGTLSCMIVIGAGLLPKLVKSIIELDPIKTADKMKLTDD